MTQSNVETAHEIYGAFAKGDVPTVLGAFSPDIIWTEFSTPGLPWAGAHHGPNEVVQNVFMALLGNFDGVSVAPEEILPVGDNRVLVLGRIKGTNKATGKFFDSPFVHLATFTGDKITKMDIFEDTGSMVSTMN